MEFYRIAFLFHCRIPNTMRHFMRHGEHKIHHVPQCLVFRDFRNWSRLLGHKDLIYRYTSNHSILFNITHIQHYLSHHFMFQGSEQLGCKLNNTRKWIGATEVVTVLSWLRINCQLVDFHRPTSSDGRHPDLFNFVLKYFEEQRQQPPLYLQHQGKM